MGLGRDIAAVYRRAGLFARAMPLLMLVPVALELVRQGIGRSGAMPAYGPAGFTIASTLVMLCIMVTAFRFWRFGADSRTSPPLGWRVQIGVIAFMAIQLINEFLFTSAGHLAANMTQQRLLIPAFQILWMFASIPLYPWYVAMLSDDPLTLRQSFAAILPRWFYDFAVVFGAIFPMLVIGIVVRSAKSIDPGTQWFVLTAFADGFMIAAMTLVTDSAYFAAYRMVRPA